MSTLRIDISGVLERKGEMLAAHASQREWLQKVHGLDHYVQSMRDWSAHRGKEAGVAFAEGFRQHRFELPAGSTTVLLVRHGESAPAHPERPFPLRGGHGDPPLDAVGEKQAQLLADRLASERIEAIYVATLQRTRQTAAPLAARLGCPVIEEPDLREVFLGEWEGGQFRVRAAAGDPVFRQNLANGEALEDVIRAIEEEDAKL